MDTKLFNGDCLDIMRGIPDGSVDMILTDPPYGMGFKSNRRQIKYDSIANDIKLDWVRDFVEQSYRVLKPDTAFYSFCSWHKVDVFKAEIERKFSLKNIIIWEKDNASMGDLFGAYAPMYEMIIYAHKGRRALNGARFPDVIRDRRTGNKNHPTEKPVNLLRFLLDNSSNKGDVVLDPYMGSGSTGVACMQSGRNFIGIEIVKEYFDIAKNRIEAEIAKPKQEELF